MLTRQVDSADYVQWAGRMKNRQPPDSRERDRDRDSTRGHDQDRDHAPFTVRDVVASYNANAPKLAPDYEHLPFEQVHASVLDLLPDPGACVLDMGAGTGRDAAWFAANGYSVVAAEPAAGMRRAAKALHRSPDIRWMDDTLPAAEKVLRSKLTFDLIWLSAVWMHVPPGARAQAFRKLVSVMSPGGSMMLTLRQGPPPAERPMEPATAADVEALARRHGLQTVRSERVPDFLGRDGIAWEVIWLRLPDDGTGALPLLRHVVLNDRKSSTYKLALLRTVIRIADGAGDRGPGAVPVLDARKVGPDLSPRHRPQDSVRRRSRKRAVLSSLRPGRACPPEFSADARRAPKGALQSQLRTLSTRSDTL